MPSERVTEALAALAPAREAYRSAVVGAAEELRSYLEQRVQSAEARVSRIERELGPFARGRIDPAGLAALLPREPTLEGEAAEVAERAVGIFEERAAAEPMAYAVAVPPGGDLRDVVRDALADVGRVFGAARAVELARSGRYRPDEHNALLSAYPHRRWSPAERRVGPPLVVEVDGADLHPSGLADFLDGGLKLVLLVRGATRPAPLARLVSPGVWVAQCGSVEELRAMASWPGPGVAAVPDGEDGGLVRFAHDPAAGERPWERILLGDEPAALRERLARERERPAGEGSEELAHLLSLATPPVRPGAAPSENGGGAEGGAPAAPEPSPADRLAAWLLARTESAGASGESP